MNETHKADVQQGSDCVSIVIHLVKILNGSLLWLCITPADQMGMQNAFGAALCGKWSIHVKKTAFRLVSKGLHTGHCSTDNC